MTPNSAGLFTAIPETLSNELVSEFQKIERNFREGRWEPSELSGGKLCEVAYCILKGHVDGTFPVRASKPPNMIDACKSLEKSGPQFSRSVRIQIPRMIVSLYEIRNNRGVGHVGGDVDPNHMDAVCVLHMSKWIVSELVRIFHGVTTEEATAVVNALADRELTLLWKVGNVTRVLDVSLPITDQTMLLLYGSSAGLTEVDLVKSVEHPNSSNFRRDVLRRLHKKRWIEYEESDRKVTISPLGSKHVEAHILSRAPFA